MLRVSTSHSRGNHGWRFTARMQVRKYQRGVQEKSFGHRIFHFKNCPWDTKLRRHTKSHKSYKNTWISYSKQCFRVTGVLRAWVMESTWLVQTQVILYITLRWASRAPLCFRSWWAHVSLLGWFFEDCSRSNLWILMVARKSNTTSQCASASTSEVCRKNRLGIDFSILRIVHETQNCDVIENHRNHAKYMEFLFETMLSWLGRVVRIHITWLVET